MSPLRTSDERVTRGSNNDVMETRKQWRRGRRFRNFIFFPYRFALFLLPLEDVTKNDVAGGRGLIVTYRARKSEVTRPPLGHSYLPTYLPTYRITPPSVISNFSFFSQTLVKISRKCLVQPINRPIADPLSPNETLLDFLRRDACSDRLFDDGWEARFPRNVKS